MVAADHRDVLQGELNPDQFVSADSSPPALSHFLGFAPGAQVIAVFSVVSFGLLLLFNYLPTVVAAMPEHDLYFSDYAGVYVLPLRIVVMSFFIAFASAIAAPWPVRLCFAADLLIRFLLFCAMTDLCNSLLIWTTGMSVPLHVMDIVSGLAGFMIFASGLLRCADMPQAQGSPMRGRYKVVSLLTVATAIAVSAALAIWIGHMHLSVVSQMRNIALLGGVSVGVFLLVPLLFFLLNIYAAIQALFRRVPHFAPDITVIIPAYNEERSIAANIEAIDDASADFGGTLTLLVIDNNSTDATVERARAAFADCKHMTCRIVEEQKAGKSWALNRGLAEVQTEFFARVDADTLLTKDALRLAFRHFGHEHVGAVGGVALPPGGGTFDGPRYIEIVLKLGYDQVAFGACDIIFGLPGMFACYRTEAVREVGGFAHGMNGEDTDVALRIGEAGYRVMVDPDATFFSEVPRNFAHLREQRLRWFRSIFHATARNRHITRLGARSVRGQVIVPFMLANTVRRAMTVPMLLFALNFMLVDPDPNSAIRLAAVLALLLGAPLVTAVIAILVNLRFEALLYLPSYIVFRMIRAYLTMEAMLSMSFNAYTRRVLGDKSGTGPAAKAAPAAPAMSAPTQPMPS